MNAHKTEAMWLGASRNGPNETLPIPSINHPMRILGVYFTYNEKLRRELNLDSILKNMKEILKLWKWRNLTLFGKVQILKTFIVPKIL